MVAKEMVMTRIFDAPRELVFAAFTQPEHLAKWWGPHHFTNPLVEVDVRLGGVLRIHMADPAGNLYPMEGVFREIIAPKRLVFHSKAFEDADGNYMLEVLHTVTLEDYQGQSHKTKLTLHAVVLKESPEIAGPLSGMEEGWSQSFERLAAMLE